MAKCIFKADELQTYIPPGHTGVVNIRLVKGDQVDNCFEMALGIDEGGGSVEPHWHSSSYQVYYILEGRGEVKIGDAIPEEFGPGSVIIIPPKKLHSMWSTRGQKTRVIVIYSPSLRPDGTHYA
jgi:mannose-6-phosphate isomerase-like protein (cupin superfamily)